MSPTKSFIEKECGAENKTECPRDNSRQLESKSTYLGTVHAYLCKLLPTEYCGNYQMCWFSSNHYLDYLSQILRFHSTYGAPSVPHVDWRSRLNY